MSPCLASRGNAYSVLHADLTSPSVTRALYLRIFQYRLIETNSSLPTAHCRRVAVPCDRSPRAGRSTRLIPKRLRSERRVCSQRFCRRVLGTPALHSRRPTTHACPLSANSGHRETSGATKRMGPKSGSRTTGRGAQSKCQLRGTGLGTLQVRVILFGRIETTSGKTRAADRSGAHQRAPRRW
jgi:hypothetical protein